MSSHFPEPVLHFYPILPQPRLHKRMHKTRFNDSFVYKWMDKLGSAGKEVIMRTFLKFDNTSIPPGAGKVRVRASLRVWVCEQVSEWVSEWVNERVLHIAIYEYMYTTGSAPECTETRVPSALDNTKLRQAHADCAKRPMTWSRARWSSDYESL